MCIFNSPIPEGVLGGNRQRLSVQDISCCLASASVSKQPMSGQPKQVPLLANTAANVCVQCKTVSRATQDPEGVKEMNADTYPTTLRLRAVA